VHRTPLHWAQAQEDLGSSEIELEHSRTAELTARHQIHLGVVLRFFIGLDVLICINP
jgi:hypothetical protein